MFFRTQRSIICLFALAGMVWAAYLGVSDAALGSWALLLAPVLFMAFTMALEFALLALVSRQFGENSPRINVLVKAWLGELLASSKVFLWQQPFRSERWPNQLSDESSGRVAILLVHGFICNRGLWNPWLAKLTQARVPFVALSLQPVFASISDYEHQIEIKVREILAVTGRAPIVVAHSMGGLAVRYWWARQRHDGQPRVQHLFTLGSPHGGTWLARFGFSRNARQMRMNSRWIAHLASMEPVAHRMMTSCYYSSCDNVVFPPAVATLKAAKNCELQGVAHVAMVFEPEPLQAVLAMREEVEIQIGGSRP